MGTAHTENTVNNTTKVVDFDSRCQQAAMCLWQGGRVTITEQQLRWYGVTPHQMVRELLNWVQSEEAQEVFDAQAYLGDEAYLGRQFTVYCTKCTKRGGVYFFQAKVLVSRES